jgi:hypothetical protein
MKIPIPYEVVQERYPELISQVMSRLRSGKSKERNREASELTWYIDWGQQIKAMSFCEMLSSVGEPRDDFPSRYDTATPENVKEFLGDSIFWGITGKAGRWEGYSKSQGQDIPPELLNFYVAGFTKDIEERKRVDSLTPEQRQAEIDECLQILRKDSGFMEFSIPLKR